MTKKTAFYKLSVPIAGLALWAFVTAQPTYAHPSPHDGAQRQHNAGAIVASSSKELAAPLNIGVVYEEVSHKPLPPSKLSKALAVVKMQEEIGIDGECIFCQCVAGTNHRVLCNWLGGSYCFPLTHDCVWIIWDPDPPDPPCC